MAGLKIPNTHGFTPDLIYVEHARVTDVAMFQNNVARFGD
jgi:hypothetical protein